MKSKTPLAGVVRSLIARDPGAQDVAASDSSPDVYLERSREWLRKWNDYLTIGNGAGLLACASAVKDAHVSGQDVAACAWCFFIGVVSAGLVPAARYGVANAKYRSAQRRLSGDPVGSPVLEDPAPYSFLSGILAATACVGFCVGVGVALVRIGAI